MELRWMTPADVDDVVAASELFDHAARPDWTARFLDSPDHHLCIAYEDGEPVGFVSGIETTHPDKGTEMFLYELGVREQSRRRGIGRALVEALARFARDRACYGMWVLTDADNAAALATYRRAGAGAPANQVMLEWNISREEVGGAVSR
jgi:ribosomal protein S18 acetylase RimI-like enzyme